MTESVQNAIGTKISETPFRASWGCCVGLWRYPSFEFAWALCCLWNKSAPQTHHPWTGSKATSLMSSIVLECELSTCIDPSISEKLELAKLLHWQHGTQRLLLMGLLIRSWSSRCRSLGLPQSCTCELDSSLTWWHMKILRYIKSMLCDWPYEPPTYTLGVVCCGYPI